MVATTANRQVVLDTETTGISTADGHRIIEIGCVEMVSRKLTGNTFHQYINPEREVEAGAFEVHGISNDFLKDKPVFSDICEDFLSFIDGAELIIHNAPFDVGFIDHELKLLQEDPRRVESMCTVLDTLKMARDKHPGQKNNLDALCKRYDVDNSNRDLHGALLDSEILADVYLAMTGGQVSMLLAAEEDIPQSNTSEEDATTVLTQRNLKVLKADAAELEAHQAMLEKVQEYSGNCLWLSNSAD